MLKLQVSPCNRSISVARLRGYYKNKHVIQGKCRVANISFLSSYLFIGREKQNFDRCCQFSQSRCRRHMEQTRLFFIFCRILKMCAITLKEGALTLSRVQVLQDLCCFIKRWCRHILRCPNMCETRFKDYFRRTLSQRTLI